MGTTAQTAMQYEDIKLRRTSKERTETIERQAYKKLVNKHSTAYTLWVLILKHRLGLLVALNVFWLVNWALPEWPQFVASVFN